MRKPGGLTRLRPDARARTAAAGEIERGPVSGRSADATLVAGGAIAS